MLPNPPEPTAEVIAAERAWLAAHLQLDLAALERLMADEYVQVNDRGELVGKQEVLASFQGGRRIWQEASSGEYKVRVYGHTAVVLGRWQARGINAGQHFDYAARYVAVWVYREARWQIVSDQSTTINDQQ